MEDLSLLTYDALSAQKHPAFYKAGLYVDQPEDTFIHMGGWTKGVVFLNGFNLGRYWKKGPQQTLFVPAPLLRQGNNDIVVFELHGTEEAAITFTDTPVLNS
jgi:beta-galactosidase